MSRQARDERVQIPYRGERKRAGGRAVGQNLFHQTHGVVERVAVKDEAEQGEYERGGCVAAWSVFLLLHLLLLIALTGTFMYAELQCTVSDWE